MKLGSVIVGDERKELFEDLIKRYYKMVYCYAFTRIKNHHTSEDIVQEVFYRAYRSLDLDTKDSKDLVGWFYRTASNCCMEYLRNQKKHQKIAKAEKVNSPSSAEEILEAISKLSEEEQTILAMKYQNRMNCQEIAGVLGRPVGTIKSILSRAYDQLRSILKKEGYSYEM
jgi:RNA polymerase sigma-70 factor (ECF subfamily)